MPLVSVVIATYNRSNVLKIAIDSVVSQTVKDWELWVIGDACVDDTEAVVYTFSDPRINFVNLEHNTGEQSGPNNEGTRRANGRYIAYLNHDDFWLPDHLETLVNGIEKKQADMVYSMLDIVRGGMGKWAPPRLCGIAPNLVFHPRSSVQASCWLFRRELIDRIGPWKYYKECKLVPSEDWLYRAWKAGTKIHCIPWLTVVAFPSMRRSKSYSDRHEHEQRHYYRLSRDPSAFRIKELTEIAAGYRMYGPEFLSARTLLSQLITSLSYSLCMRLGLHPFTVRFLIQKTKPGSKIDRYREIRGLHKLNRLSEK